MKYWLFDFEEVWKFNKIEKKSQKSDLNWNFELSPRGPTKRFAVAFLRVSFLNVALPWRGTRKRHKLAFTGNRDCFLHTAFVRQLINGSPILLSFPRIVYHRRRAREHCRDGSWRHSNKSDRLPVSRWTSVFCMYNITQLDLAERLDNITLMQGNLADNKNRFYNSCRSVERARSQFRRDSLGILSAQCNINEPYILSLTNVMRIINEISTWHARNCLTKTQRFNISAMEKIKWKVARRNQNCELNEGKHYMLCASKSH